MVVQVCECLEHDDRTITLCEVCADTWRLYESDMARMHKVIDAQNKRLAALERVREAAEMCLDGADERGTSAGLGPMRVALAACQPAEAPKCERCGGLGKLCSWASDPHPTPCPACPPPEGKARTLIEEADELVQMEIDRDRE